MVFCIENSTLLCTAKTFQASRKKHININLVLLAQYTFDPTILVRGLDVFQFIYIIHVCCRCSHDRGGWRIDGRTYFSRK